MGSPDRFYRLGVKGAIVVGIGLVIANRFGLIKIGESSQPVITPETQSLNIPEKNYETGVVSENLTLALHWVAFQRNPAFDSAIADISRIQGEIFENGNLTNIADLNSNSFDEKYADVLYRKDEKGESLTIGLSEERFTDRVFNSAEAGRDLLIAWRKLKLAENNPRRFRNDPGFREVVDQQALDFVNAQLARH